MEFSERTDAILEAKLTNTPWVFDFRLLCVAQEMFGVKAQRLDWVHLIEEQ